MYRNKWYLRSQAERRTLNEALELFLADGLGLHLYLQRHEDGEEELVGLVETAGRVREGQVSQVIDDVLDAPRRERRPVGARHGDVKQLQELSQRQSQKLSQRRLVHAVDVAHRHDQEVEHRTARRHCNRHQPRARHQRYADRVRFGPTV